MKKDGEFHSKIVSQKKRVFRLVFFRDRIFGMFGIKTKP